MIRLRIVQLANFYAPTSGGLRTSVDAIGSGYHAAGHERILVVPGPADAEEETPHGRRITIRSPRLGASGTYRLLTDRHKVRLTLDGLAPDVLEVSDKLSVGWLAPWARHAGVHLAMFSHERIDAILRSRVPYGFPLAAVADVINRRLCRVADEVIVTSRFAAAEFRRIGAGNVRRVPLGVDLATFRPDGRVLPGPVRLVLLSRLSREKRPERAVEAVRRLVRAGLDVELTVIGHGPHRARLHRRAAGLPVRFLGHISDRRSVAALVAASDVALAPSPAETFGLAVLESLACGTPVVVPADGAVNELLGGEGSGVVCDGAPQSLADGVRQLLDIPVATRRAAARAAAERFPWTATVAAMLSGYATGSRGPVDASAAPAAQSQIERQPQPCEAAQSYSLRRTSSAESDSAAYSGRCSHSK